MSAHGSDDNSPAANRDAKAKAGRSLILAVLAFAMPLLPGCVGFNDHSWRFALTRAIFDDVDLDPSGSPSVPPPGLPAGGNLLELCFYAVVLVTPLVIDTVLLPVTWPHDLMRE